MQPEEILDASLRNFRNQVFHFALFDERCFLDDHYHCIACWKKVAGPEYTNAEHEGYVTLHEAHYTGFPIMMQYAWVCNECFPRYQDSYGWKFSTDSVPEIPEETRRAFSVAYQKYLSGLDSSK